MAFAGFNILQFAGILHPLPKYRLQIFLKTSILLSYGQKTARE
jgi:hypothetical protein